jgi:hypothetical protein
MLLRPLAVLLALWEGFLWLTALFGISLNLYIAETIAACSACTSTSSC